jgi:hypothetical protein
MDLPLRAYVVAISIVAISLAADHFELRTSRLFWLSLAAAAAMLTVRAVGAVGEIPMRSWGQYAQQRQTALFLARYYAHANLAANDIGQINYYADLDCLDLVGLGSIGILQARRADAYTTDVISEEAKSIESRSRLFTITGSHGKPTPSLAARLCRETGSESPAGESRFLELSATTP